MRSNAIITMHKEETEQQNTAQTVSAQTGTVQTCLTCTNIFYT